MIALLARGGGVGGTSAGALVWGSECQVFRAPADGSPFHVGTVESLLLGDPHSTCFGALRHGVVVPHFTEFGMRSSLEATLAGRPHLLGIGIDEATALEIHGSIVRVLGRGKATILDSRHQVGSELVLDSGSGYDITRQVAL
jgi:cyanophycinase